MNERFIYRPVVGRVLLPALVVASLVLGCGIFPENTSVDDPRVRPLLKAAASFDRTTYGFSPLPTSGCVRLELRPRAGYDATLHLGGKTSRTIASRKDGSGYFWIGEQETLEGPKVFKTVDGTFHEAVVLDFEKEHVSGFPLNRLNVLYRGEDPRFAGRVDLALTDVTPLLREWGY